MPGELVHGDGSLASTPPEWREVTAEEVSVAGVPWRVAIRLMRDHSHHLCVECEGHLVATHVGGLPAQWPEDAFPAEVQDAIVSIAESLSWS